MRISRTKQNSYRHGIATCTCIEEVNTAVPVITRSSARSVWERSEETSGGGLETFSLKSISISFRLSVPGSDTIVSLYSSVLDRSHLSICTVVRIVGHVQRTEAITFYVFQSTVLKMEANDSLLLG
jgi:hypothetical protein